MDQDDEYRKKATEAQGYADRAVSDDDRASWLRIVEGWLGLIRKRPQTSQERLDEAAQSRS